MKWKSLVKHFLKNGKKQEIKNPSYLSAGFSLLEVMIALTVFSLFVTAFMATEGYNVADSAVLNKELILKKLCQNKLNEIIINPPRLEESLTTAPQQGNFTLEGHPDYEFTIEYQRLKIPDLSGGNSSDSETSANGENSTENQDQILEKMIFENIKKNMEELIWQVRVSVKEKGTGYNYSLSTLIDNPRAKVQIRL